MAVVRAIDRKPRLRELGWSLWKCSGRGTIRYGQTMEDAYLNWMEARAIDLMRPMGLLEERERNPRLWLASKPKRQPLPWHRRVLRWLGSLRGAHCLGIVAGLLWALFTKSFQ